jgi:hypothetical protein
MFTVELKGAEELKAKLRQLPEKVKAREVANIASKSLRPIKKEAEAILTQHSVTGNARKAILSKRLVRSTKFAGSLVGWNYGRRRAPHWKMVEFGIDGVRPVVSKRGIMRTKNREKLIYKNGQAYRRVNLPGIGWRLISNTGKMPAVAPMRKAIAKYGSQQGKDYIREMERYIKRKVSQLTKKYGV